MLNQRLSSPVLLRYLDALTAPYQELAKAYRKCATSASGAGGSAGSSTASAEISHLVESNGDVFLHDKNLGLVKQILRSLVKKQVTRLTQTYLTFSLADVAAHINMQQQQQGAAAQAQPAQMAEKYVFDMVRPAHTNSANRHTRERGVDSADPASTSLCAPSCVLSRSALATCSLVWIPRPRWFASWRIQRSTTQLLSSI